MSGYCAQNLDGMLKCLFSTHTKVCFSHHNLKRILILNMFRSTDGHQQHFRTVILFLNSCFSPYHALKVFWLQSSVNFYLPTSNFCFQSSSSVMYQHHITFIPSFPSWNFLVTSLPFILVSRVCAFPFLSLLLILSMTPKF